MKVESTCFSKLVSADTCNFNESTQHEIADGENIEKLVQRAGLPKEGVSIAFVNNRKVELDTILSDGDRVGLAPAVGGM